MATPAIKRIPHFFEHGFSEFLESGQFHDVVLVVGSREFKAHKIILSHGSIFFRKMLSSEFKEPLESRIELHYDDIDDVFPHVLSYLYIGRIDLSEKVVVPLLAIADHLLVDSLKALCNQYLDTKITQETCLFILQKAIEFRQDLIEEKCMRIVAKNFHFLVNADFSFLSMPVMQKLLRHPNLAVKSEISVYNVICNYINVKGPDQFKEDDLNSLFETVRFPFFTLKQLERADHNDIVPKHLIIEGLMSKLRRVESPDDENAAQSIRMQPRESYGVNIPFLPNKELMGVLYAIATNFWTEAWTNPVGKVEITASSIEKGDPAQILNPTEPKECWTKDIPASWFQLDLGVTRKAVVTHYTIRHGGNYKADSLRYWDFQGSMDGKTWTALSRHKNDRNLNANFAVKSWALESEDATAYRFFRILQKGHNSSDRNFLAISGLEIYGDLYELNENYLDLERQRR